MFDKRSILNFLDNAFEQGEMPCFGNMNIDYVSPRLSVYRNQDKWLLLFNSIVWWPAAEGLMAMVETVGTGVIGKQGFDDDRTFAPGRIEMNDTQDRILSITVRGEAVDPSVLTIQPNYDLQADYEFWAAVALAEKYKERLLASEAEIARFIPLGFKHLLTIDEWDHPDWDTPPSRTATFPALADILITADPSLWKPVAAPNTHWSHWYPK